MKAFARCQHAWVLAIATLWLLPHPFQPAFGEPRGPRAELGASGSTAPTVVVLRNAVLIDGVADVPRPNVTIIIRDGRIASIGGDDADAPPESTVIDVAGRWLLPGLIDAHVHLQDLASARRALQAGVTTARVLGVNHYADVGIRELHRAGAADVPDVLASGYQITWPPGEALLLDFPGLRTPLTTRGPDAVRAVVRANASRGVDWIKVLATQRAGLVEQDPLLRQLADAELQAAVSQARADGLPVAAHAHSDEGIRAAVMAGVTTIEHGTFGSDETLALMKARGVCFMPTYAGWSTQWDGVNDDPVLSARARTLAPGALDTVRRAVALGVPIVAGMDGTYGARDRYTVVDEIVALAAAGLPPVQAIRAATSTAADCLGIGSRTGRITVGLEADLISVAADPMADLAALRQPWLVINEGAVAVRRPDKAASAL